MNRLGEVVYTWTNEQMSSVVQKYNSVTQQLEELRRVYTEVKETRQKVLDIWNCKRFVRLLFMALIMFCLAFTIAQTFAIILPWIFAVVFSLGVLLIMGAFLSLMGWQGLLKTKLCKKGVLFGGLYWLSVFATLYSAIAWKNYLVCFCFAIFQVVSLFGYVVSCMHEEVEKCQLFFRKVYNVHDLLQRCLSSLRINEEPHEELHE